MYKRLKISTLIACLVAGGQSVLAEAIKVEVVKTGNGGFELLRGGEPYRIKGAGAPSIDTLERVWRRPAPIPPASGARTRLLPVPIWTKRTSWG